MASQEHTVQSAGTVNPESQVSKFGLPPGSLIHVGAKKLDQVQIRFLDYDALQMKEQEAESIEACFPLKETPTISWIDIVGLHDVAIIEKLGQQFDIHSLLMEDVLNTNQRPKLEESESCLLIVLKGLRFNATQRDIQHEQISLVLGTDFVISFEEDTSDVFDPIRKRLRSQKGKIRKRGVDYLLYALLDAVVDSYFSVLEEIGDYIESLEEELVAEPTETTLHRIYTLKREMVALRRSIWPLREITASLARSDSELIGADTHLYFNDVHDHTMQAIETVEGFRDEISSMLDLYLSSISHRLNRVMHVLTLTATIFIPLTFIAGIYGMNFEHMPELKWRYGYFLIWGFMIVVGVGMVVFFKRKKWL